jgi:hypothetical protein
MTTREIQFSFKSAYFFGFWKSQGVLYAMKNILLILPVLVFFNCGGTLSDEQRKQMREQMEAHRIKRVSPTEITEAAFAKGRSIIAEIKDFESDPEKVDSIMNASQGKILWIAKDGTPKHPMVQELFEAYKAAGTSSSQQDNVQQIRNSEESADSILYTQPIVVKTNDSTKLAGVWNIWLSKKELVLAMKKKK